MKTNYNKQQIKEIKNMISIHYMAEFWTLNKGTVPPQDWFDLCCKTDYTPQIVKSDILTQILGDLKDHPRHQDLIDLEKEFYVATTFTRFLEAQKGKIDTDQMFPQLLPPEQQTHPASYFLRLYTTTKLKYQK